MTIVGLTGGIGSGKSVVADLLRVMGYSVYDSDSRSKELCDTDSDIILGLKSLFGEDVYINGFLNRSLLAKKIFNDKKVLASVNSIIHPSVERDFIYWAKQKDPEATIFQESAIIFEANLSNKFDFIICVNAPENLRILRTCKRSKLSHEEVSNRIKQQLGDDERAKLSDFVIVNDGIKGLIPQLEEMIEVINIKKTKKQTINF